MASQILDARPLQAHRNIRPPHAGELAPIQLVLVWICDVAKVHYSCIVVILAGEDCGIEIIGVNVSNRMLVGVPSSEAEIKSPHEGDFAIYEAKLLVVGPVQNYVIGHAV